MSPPRKAPDHPPEFVRDISVIVYRNRMGETDADAYIAEHGLVKFANNAGAYDVLTRAYLKALGITTSAARVDDLAMVEF